MTLEGQCEATAKIIVGFLESMLVLGLFSYGLIHAAKVEQHACGLSIKALSQRLG